MFRYVLVAIAVFLPAMLVGCRDNTRVVGGSGLIETDDVIVSAQTSGQVLQRFFDEGSEVRPGDTLALIDTSRLLLQIQSLRAARNVAEKQLATAKVQTEIADSRESFTQKELDRISRLLASGTATQKQFDQAQFEYTQARLALEAARARVGSATAQIAKLDADMARVGRELQDCTPLAPISGTVTEKYIETGELLAPGKPIARIARLDSVWVKVYLPAGEFASVKLGDEATVSTESGGRQYTGRVVWTADEAEFTPKNVQTAESRAGLVYAVKVKLANADHTLKVSMPVFVTLETK